MKLSDKEEEVYRNSCEELDAYDKMPESLRKISVIEQHYKAYLLIKTFGDGLRRGDKFYRESTGDELKSIMEITKALEDNDLIMQPNVLDKLNGTGG